MSTSDVSDQAGTNGGTIVAIFTGRDSAREALMELHQAGFRNAWLGVTHGDPASGNATATSEGDEGGGVMSSLGRFFSGEGPQEQALHQSLLAHGLDEEQARRLESTIRPGAALVTVDGENDPGEARTILKTNGGDVQTNFAAGIAMATPLTGRSTFDEQDVDGARRLELREERLSIDKQRVSTGEARVGKEVVSEQQSIDVPVFHEELFIARRPASGDAAISTSPIGEGEEIRIPLSAERVDVSKRTVVTEEVEVGTRKVAGMEHVTDTVRHEELRVDDGKTTASTLTSENPPLR